MVEMISYCYRSPNSGAVNSDAVNGGNDKLLLGCLHRSPNSDAVNGGNDKLLARMSVQITKQ